MISPVYHESLFMINLKESFLMNLSTRNPDGSFVPREDDDGAGAGEDKSVSSILNKIDSMLLKSKEDVKQYEQRKSDYVSNDDDENFSYQC